MSSNRDESDVSDFLKDMAAATRSESAAFIRAIKKAVGDKQPIELKSPYSFLWPDGRRIQFTHAVGDGNLVFLTTTYGVERVLVGQLSNDALRKIAALIPGFNDPTVLPDNVVDFGG